MAGKITREQSYVTNQALQQSSLLSTAVFQGLVHSLSKDWNQPKESTTTAPPTVYTLVIPATCEVRAQEERQRIYRRDSHSSVPSGSNSSAATSQVHTQTSTTETDYTRNAQCFITSLTVSHKQRGACGHKMAALTENLVCGVTIYGTNLPRRTVYT